MENCRRRFSLNLFDNSRVLNTAICNSLPASYVFNFESGRSKDIAYTDVEMEWCIPIDTFEIENVHLGELSTGPKPIVPFSYKDAELTFPSLVFVLPSVEVRSYNHTTGQLIISLEKSPSVLHKLVKFQEMLLSAVYTHHPTWFGVHMRKKQDVLAKYQPLIENSNLHLYCPLQNQDIPLYSNETWTMGSNYANVLVPGKRVRLVFKLQGISFHLHPNSGLWSGKFRIQHRINAILQMKN